MYITFFQEEVVKGLLETKEVTIIGFALAVIALLIYLYIRTDNKLIEANKYIKEQDKETLKILAELTHALENIKERGRTFGIAQDKISDTVTDSNLKVTQLYAMIQAKVLGMK
jgi:4-aminobutyrate aminotransferase-like enzyme